MSRHKCFARRLTEKMNNITNKNLKEMQKLKDATSQKDALIQSLTEE